ncbi:MAG: hypothetical protein H6721_08705 [Sandaracinus sp.]|nr:hypothetical protein [Sandaracinus sp.]MCB9632197.1 hypothetical protein [Sandaracinus sp.]
MTRRSSINLHSALVAMLLVGGAWASTTHAQTTEIPLAGDAVPDDGTRPRESTYETARGLGMGTGARASAAGTSALAYNPANLTLAPVYHLESFAAYIPNDRSWMYGGAVADSVTNKLAAGFSMHGVYGNEDRNYRGFDSRLALSVPFSDAIAVGIAGRYVRLRSRTENENGERVGPGVKAFTLDAGIRVTPTAGLHLAFVGQNLIPTDSSLAPMILGGGVSYSYEALFTIGVDVLVDLTTFDSAELLLGGGAEVLIAGQVPIRLGYRRDQGRELNQITAAVGYVDQKVGIDIALRQDIGGPKETQLLFAFRYHVQ